MLLSGFDPSGYIGRFPLTLDQQLALYLTMYQPQGPFDVYDQGGYVNICFSGEFSSGGDAGPRREYACINPGLSTAEVLRILGVSTQPKLVSEPTKVTAKPVESSGPVLDTAIKPPSQTWTDIAVPVPTPSEGWVPTGDLTSEGGPPSSIAVPISAKTSTETKPFPWGLLAIAAALVMGS